MGLRCTSKRPATLCSQHTPLLRRHYIITSNKLFGLLVRRSGLRDSRMTSLRFDTRSPSISTLERWSNAHRVGALPFNHGFMPGGGAHEDSARLRLFHLSCELGSGRRCYKRARRLLLSWQMHAGSKHTGIWTDDEALVTWARLLPGCWVLNPCRILPASVLAGNTGHRSSSVGYATTRGHLIAGCEQMSVHWGEDDVVRFEVRSASRGAGLLGRAIFPLLTASQRRFFSDQCRCMQWAVGAHAALPKRKPQRHERAQTLPGEFQNHDRVLGFVGP